MLRFCEPFRCASRLKSGPSPIHPFAGIWQAHNIAEKPTWRVNRRLSETSAPETAPAGAAVRQAWLVARRGGGICRRPCARQTGRERRDREPTELLETQGPGEARAAGKAPLLMVAARKRGARPNASAIVTRRAETLQGLGEATGALSPAKMGHKRTRRNRARSRPEVGRRRAARLFPALRLTNAFL